MGTRSGIWRRAGAALVAAATVSASVAGAGRALADQAAAAKTKAAATETTAPRFSTDGLWITDAQGRELFLRGFDLTGAEDTPTKDPLPYTLADFKAMRADGATVVRLPIAWSMIEPTEGHFDTAALDRARQIVGWAGKAGLFAVLDMHQYDWSPCLGGNGMPAWAVPDCPATPPSDPIVQEADVQRAATAFWQSSALQADFAQAWVRVAQVVGAPANLLGYDILNEPEPGLTAPEVFETEYLTPFYRAVGARLRAVDPGGLLFVEPSAVNGVVNGSSQMLGPIGLPGVVYEPHQYGLDALNGDGTGGSGVADVGGPTQFAADVELDDAVAQRMDAAVWLGEWGALSASYTSYHADAWVDDDLTAQDSVALGSAYWSWDSADAQPDIIGELTRITPTAVGGSVETIVTSTGSTALTWASSGEQTTFSIPASCRPVATVVTGKAIIGRLSNGWLPVRAPAGTTADVSVACVHSSDADSPSSAASPTEAGPLGVDAGVDTSDNQAYVVAQGQPSDPGPLAGYLGIDTQRGVTLVGCGSGEYRPGDPDDWNQTPTSPDNNAVGAVGPGEDTAPAGTIGATCSPLPQATPTTGSSCGAAPPAHPGTTVPGGSSPFNAYYSAGSGASGSSSAAGIDGAFGGASGASGRFQVTWSGSGGGEPTGDVVTGGNSRAGGGTVAVGNDGRESDGAFTPAGLPVTACQD